MILYPAASIAERRSGGGPPPPPAPFVQYSINLTGTGQADLASAPAAGGLFSAWVRIPTQIVADADYTQGNIYPFRVFGTNWEVFCITGNTHYLVSNGDAWYNANTTFGLNDPVGGANGFGDETFYLQEWLPIAQLNAWVFTEWWICVEPDGTFRKSQWVLYPGQPAIGPQTTDWTLAALRAQAITNGWSPAVANAYTPSQLDHLAIAYTENPGMLARCRIEARNTLPSNAYIESVAALTAPDPAAWAFYQCDVNLSSGLPQIVDSSGNGRTPTWSTPTIYSPGVPTQDSTPNVSYLLGLTSS